ncbi:hypothetical protein [Burkholderia vietnamiensis]
MQIEHIRPKAQGGSNRTVNLNRVLTVKYFDNLGIPRLT